MGSILNKITKEEFEIRKDQVLFNDKIVNNRFAIITNGTNSFKIAWYSDLIDPVITEITTDIYCIGIDQNFAIIDFQKRMVHQVLFVSSIPLTY